MTPITTTLQSIVEDAFALIDEIRGEFEEYVDSVSGTGLENAERTQEWSDAADALSNIDQVDVPECAEALTVDYTPAKIPRRISGVARRRLLRDQAASMLSAAAAAAQAFRDEQSEKADELAKSGQHEDEFDALVRQDDELDTLIEALERAADDAGNVEF